MGQPEIDMMATLWRSKAPLTLPWIEENNYPAF